MTFGVDDVKCGEQVMEELAKIMNGKGVVAILAGNQNAPNLQKRVQGDEHQAAEDPDDLLRRGAAKVYRPEELVEACKALGPDAVLRLQPLEGGIPPEVAWEGLHLFEDEVLPHLP